MAEIDLKQARIFIRDGFSAAGAVNNVSGYTSGATTVAVDAIAGIIPTGTLLKFTGQTTTYTVVSHTETSSNTTSIVITPGLTASVVDNVVITFQPHSLEVRIGDGNLTYEEKKNYTYKLDRGKLYTVKAGDEAPIEVNIDFSWESIAGDTDDPPSIEEALKKIGKASTWVSSSADLCEPYSVDIVVEYTEPCGDGDVQKLTLPDFRVESLNHSFKDGTITCKGQCNATDALTERVAA